MKQGAGLMPSARGAKVSFSNGKPTVVDGPFAEAKELIAGYSIIEAASLAEVIELVKDWPQSDGHGNVQVEIRQIATAESLGFDEQQLDRYNKMVGPSSNSSVGGGLPGRRGFDPLRCPWTSSALNLQRSVPSKRSGGSKPPN